MKQNIIELGASRQEEKEKIRISARKIIDDSHGFVMVYREAASRSWKFMYSSVSDEDLIVIGTLLQAKGIEGFIDEE